MIQELLGGSSTLIGGERKISPSLSPSPSSPTIATTAETTATSASENQNLRCPRCNSSNTKFCYYNNYNLTQPRHFCKTCRRYWTKGGALRNVPIGGGCRKNKTVGSATATSLVKSVPARFRTVSSREPGRLELNGSGGFGQDPGSSPVLWASPENPHLLALLRSAQNRNPHLNLNPMSAVKEESILLGNTLTSETTEAMNSRTLGLGQFSNFWRSNQSQFVQQQNGIIFTGEAQNSGIHELYQRLRSASKSYPDHAQVLPNNVASSSLSSSSSTILESAPVGELGYWNPTFSWSDLPTANSSYPQ
ncbi:hypothetical protein NMG60_11026110 [Bertholletia excelsa]